MTGVSGSGAAPTPKLPPHRGVRGAVAFLVLGLCIVLVVLFLFADKLPPGMAALPGHLQRIAPYGIVALIGAIVGLAEIASTFLNYPREALRTRWGQLLILVNALAAALAFWIAWTYAPDANLPLLVIGVGVGFQALIRTRFTNPSCSL